MKKQPMRGTGDPRPPDDPEQSKRFEETARELEIDEPSTAFERALTDVLPASRGKDQRPLPDGNTSPAGGR